MTNSIVILRRIEESADALVRLDAVVALAPAGLGSLLMLRTAHEIASREGRMKPTDGAFAALLGWWYAAESRHVVADDADLRAVALALDGAVEKVRGGRPLTPAFALEIDLDPAHPGLSPVLESVLQRAHDEAWPALLLAAELCAGECGADATMTAAITRAVAPVAGGLTTDAFVAPGGAEAAADALHALAVRARTALTQVRTYLRAGEAARERAAAWGRGAPTARALIDLLVGEPALTVLGASAALGVSVPSTGAAMRRLLDDGIVREITGRGRDRVFVYAPATALAG